nr:fertilization antigen-1 [Mus musculus]
MTEADVNPKPIPSQMPTSPRSCWTLFNSHVTTSSFGKEPMKPPKPSTEASLSYIVMAADAEPLEIILHPPSAVRRQECPLRICALQAGFRTACGVSRPVIACSVTIKEGSQLKQQIQSIQQSIERLWCRLWPLPFPVYCHPVVYILLLACTISTSYYYNCTTSR